VRRLPLLLFAGALVLAGCGDDDGGSEDSATVTSAVAPEGIDGVVAWNITDNSHVEGAVEYGQSPPVAGPHNPVFANCKFYDGEIPNENVVHSLEHGSVWITYTSDADEATLATIQDLVGQSDHLIASLYPSQDSPIVLTAWNRQLAVDSVDDPRVQEFVDTYLLADDLAPEPGAACSGGAG
jgi:hypothetical protein